MTDTVSLILPEAEAPKPSLVRAATYKHRSDAAEYDLAQIRHEIETDIRFKVVDLQQQIEKIEKEAEAKFTDRINALIKIIDDNESLYNDEIYACAAAGILEEAQYELKNTTKIERPINLDKFKAAFPGLFETIATIQKGTAKAALMLDYKMSAKVAETQLTAVCDEVRSGPPVWTLAVIKTGRGKS